MKFLKDLATFLFAGAPQPPEETPSVGTIGWRLSTQYHSAPRFEIIASTAKTTDKVIAEIGFYGCNLFRGTGDEEAKINALGERLSRSLVSAIESFIQHPARASTHFEPVFFRDNGAYRITITGNTCVHQVGLTYLDTRENRTVAEITLKLSTLSDRSEAIMDRIAQDFLASLTPRERQISQTAHVREIGPPP